MDKNLILKKFGKEYFVDSNTYHMGIHHLLSAVIAKRFLGHKICLDACLGAGFMTLALTKYVDKIIGVDIDLLHLKQAKDNAKVLSVEDKIQFVQGDVLKVIKTIGKIDSAFLDPDWAKAGDSKENHVSDFSQMIPPADLLLKEVFKKTNNICLRLPKEFDLKKLSVLPEHEIESVYLDNSLKFYCVYFGDLIINTGNTELKV